jgi:hypothetical protein
MLNQITITGLRNINAERIECILEYIGIFYNRKNLPSLLGSYLGPNLKKELNQLKILTTFWAKGEVFFNSPYN